MLVCADLASEVALSKLLPPVDKKPHDTFERCVMATHSLFGQVYHYITIEVLHSLFGHIYLRIKLSYLYNTFRLILVGVFEKYK